MRRGEDAEGGDPRLERRKPQPEPGKRKVDRKDQDEHRQAADRVHVRPRRQAHEEAAVQERQPDGKPGQGPGGDDDGPDLQGDPEAAEELGQREGHVVHHLDVSG